jgi:predicted outer membrane lipoprotein
MLGLLFLPAGAATAVAAARGVSPLRLLGVLVACAFALIPVYVVLYILGSTIGGAMTSLADNPPINSADTDLSMSFAALLLGLLFAAISHVLTRPAAEAVAPVTVGQPE